MTEFEYKIIEGFKISRINWELIVVLITLAGFWIGIGMLLASS